MIKQLKKTFLLATLIYGSNVLCNGAEDLVASVVCPEAGVEKPADVSALSERALEVIDAKELPKFAKQDLSKVSEDVKKGILTLLMFDKEKLNSLGWIGCSTFNGRSTERFMRDLESVLLPVFCNFAVSKNSLLKDSIQYPYPLFGLFNLDDPGLNLVRKFIATDFAIELFQRLALEADRESALNQTVYKSWGRPDLEPRTNVSGPAPTFIFKVKNLAQWNAFFVNAQQLHFKSRQSKTIQNREAATERLFQLFLSFFQDYQLESFIDCQRLCNTIVTILLETQSAIEEEGSALRNRFDLLKQKLQEFDKNFSQALSITDQQYADFHKLVAQCESCCAEIRIFAAKWEELRN